MVDRGIPARPAGPITVAAGDERPYPYAGYALRPLVACGSVSTLPEHTRIPDRPSRFRARSRSGPGGFLPLEQAELEHPGGAELGEPQRRCGRVEHGSGREQADQLAAGEGDAPYGRLGFDSGDDLVNGCCLPVLDVHAHLHAPRARQLETERPHTWEPASGLADNRGHCARHLDVVRRQLDVEGDERRPGSDQHGANAGVEARRAEIGTQLSGVDSLLQRVRPAQPEERRTSAITDGSVEEDRQPVLAADTLRQRERRAPRAIHVVGHDRNERHHVRGADARVHAVVSRQVDQLAGTPDAGEQRLDQGRILADKREDTAVVVLVRVHVEQSSASPERPGELVDRARIASLRDVGDGFERQHGPYSRSVKAYYDRRAPEYDDDFTPRRLLDELSGGEVLHADHWFVAVRSCGN